MTTYAKQVLTGARRAMSSFMALLLWLRFPLTIFLWVTISGQLIISGFDWGGYLGASMVLAGTGGVLMLAVAVLWTLGGVTHEEHYDGK